MREKLRFAGWLLGLLVLAACARERPAPPTDQTRREAPVPRRSIEEVMAEHVPALMRIPGVVGVAQGAAADGTPIILVLLAREDAATRARIPQSLEGYAVEIQVTGEIRAMPDSGR